MFIAAVLAAGLLAAVLPTPAAAASLHPVVGEVSAAGYVRGGRVELLDARGRVIAGAPRLTSRSGGFGMRLRTVPRSFTVRSVGGRDEQGRVLGPLLAHYSNYRRYDPIVVNAATTVAVVYSRARPGLSSAQVRSRVGRYLHLPPGVRLGVDLALNDSEFHGNAFMRRARRNAFQHAESVVDDIDARKRVEYVLPDARRAAAAKSRGATTTGAETRDALVSDQQLVAGTASLVGTASGSAAAGALFGEVFGRVMGIESNAFNEEAAIAQVNARLDALQADVNFVIEAQYEAKVREDFDTYNASVSELSQISRETHLAWLAYTRAIRAKYGDPAPFPIGKFGFRIPVDENAARDAFIRSYDDYHRDTLIQGMDKLDAQMAGPVSGASPLEYWTRAHRDKYRFVTPQAQSRFGEAWLYWRTMQAQLLIMNIEYARSPEGRARGDYASKIPSWIDDYARRGATGGLESPRMQDWLTRSGLLTVNRDLTDAEIYDSATGIIWSNTPRSGTFDQFAGQVPNPLPTRAQVNSIFERQGAKLGMDELGYTGDRRRLQYMAAMGWESWINNYIEVITSERYDSIRAWGVFLKDEEDFFPAPTTGTTRDILFQTPLPAGKVIVPQ